MNFFFNIIIKFKKEINFVAVIEYLGFRFFMEWTNNYFSVTTFKITLFCGKNG